MSVASGSPLRPAVYRMAVVLLYTTGMRRGELLRLTLADCEPESGVLRVPESKFPKSRILPLSPDPDTPLLINTEGGLRAYTGAGISGGIHSLFKTAGVEDSEGRCPRIREPASANSIAHRRPSFKNIFPLSAA
ncbi:tyrosine-type recombinase/integrase [Sinorhizobium fredii]|nr:tyrosine-type recombinase/integrase [Sinorhizobium fredii]